MSKLTYQNYNGYLEGGEGPAIGFDTEAQKTTTINNALDVPNKQVRFSDSTGWDSGSFAKSNAGNVYVTSISKPGSSDYTTYDKIGPTASLQTSNKTVVGAINELKGISDTNSNAITGLSTAVTNLQATSLTQEQHDHLVAIGVAVSISSTGGLKYTNTGATATDPLDLAAKKDIVTQSVTLSDIASPNEGISFGTPVLGKTPINANTETQATSIVTIGSENLIGTVLDNSGNVNLTKSSSGLKGNVDLSSYATISQLNDKANQTSLDTTNSNVNKGFYWKPVSITGAGTRNVIVLSPGIQVGKTYMVEYNWQNQQSLTSSTYHYTTSGDLSTTLARFPLKFSSIVVAGITVLGAANILELVASPFSNMFSIDVAFGSVPTGGYIQNVYVKTPLNN